MTDNGIDIERLRARMDEMEVKPGELAVAAGIARQSLARGLKGETKMRATTYALLMRVLDDMEADREPGVRKYRADEGEQHNTFRIQMRGVFGVEEVIFEGDPEDADMVREEALQFVRELKGDSGQNG